MLSYAQYTAPLHVATQVTVLLPHTYIQSCNAHQHASYCNTKRWRSNSLCVCVCVHTAKCAYTCISVCTHVHVLCTYNLVSHVYTRSFMCTLNIWWCSAIELASHTWLAKHRQVALVLCNGGEQLLPHGYGGQLPSLVELTEECLQRKYSTCSKVTVDG